MIKSYMKHFLSEEIRRIKTLMSLKESLIESNHRFQIKYLML